MQFQSPVGVATTYAYDFQGIRQSKSGSAGTVNFLIDRQSPTGFEQVVRETNSTGTTLSSYIYGSHRLSQTQAGIVSYYHSDGLGSTRLLTNSSGATTDTYSFAAYGPLLTHSGSSNNTFLFAGEQQDFESNQYYLRARYYDPIVGRFLNRDSFHGESQKPLTLHKYLYAADNPVNLTDPSGLFFGLVEQQVVSFIQANLQRYEGEEKIRKAYKRSIEIAAVTSKTAGAVMAATAVFESFQNWQRPLKWFGLTWYKGVYDTFKIALDMVRQTNLQFDTPRAIEECLVNLNYYAVVPVAENGGLIPGRGAQASPPTMYVCPSFIGLLPYVFPASEVRDDEPSMAGAMVHEFSHITLGTEDHKYFCEPSLGLIPKVSFFKTPRATQNADSYRCFAEESWVGGSLTLVPFR
jgi:RHS repeat-associated protein